MIGTRPLLLPTVVAAVLVTACGQGAATAEDSAKDAAGAQTLSENAVGLDAQGLETGNRSAAAADTGSAPGSIEPAPAAALAKGAAVKSLPLKRGFYVSSDTPCAEASNATLLLVTREGINGSRDVCTFTSIEKTGANAYRVAESCPGIETGTVTYVVPNETSFTVKYDGGGEHSARFCARSSLPDPWRDNDISDLVG